MQTRMSVKEIAVNTLLLCLLLAVLIGIWPLVDHWVEQQTHRWIDPMTWREPLDNWI